MIRVLLADDNAVIRQGVARCCVGGRRHRGRGRGRDRPRGDRAGRAAAPRRRAARRPHAGDGRRQGRRAAVGPVQGHDAHLLRRRAHGRRRDPRRRRRLPRPRALRARGARRARCATSRRARWCPPAVAPVVFDRLRAARAASPANGARRGPDSLTAREREVISLLARGRSNRDIAEELVITDKTVKNHLSRSTRRSACHPRRGDRAVAGDRAGGAAGMRSAAGRGPRRGWPAGARAWGAAPAGAEPVATLAQGSPPSAVTDAAGTLHVVWRQFNVPGNLLYCRVPAGARRAPRSRSPTTSAARRTCCCARRTAR